MRAAMTLLLMMLTTATAWADNVTYFDPTDAVNPTKTAENPTVITSETTEIGSEGQTTWYYVSGTVTNGNRIEVKGTVNIILVDDCVFTASKGIRVESPNVLNIYAQKADDGCGKLIAKHEGKNAAIGSNGGPVAYGNGPDINEPDNFEGTTPDAANAPEAGTITIYGGDIYVNGNIGGGDGGDGHPSNNKSGIGGKGGDGTIIIHDGNIVVYGNMGGGKGGRIDIKAAKAAMVAQVPSLSMAAMLMFMETWVAVTMAMAMTNMEMKALVMSVFHGANLLTCLVLNHIMVQSIS